MFRPNGRLFKIKGVSKQAIEARVRSATYGGQVLAAPAPMEQPTPVNHLRRGVSPATSMLILRSAIWVFMT